MEYFQNEGKMSTRILYSEKIFLKNEDEIQTASEKRKLREYLSPAYLH